MRMCNQFRLPNLKQIQQYLKSDHGIYDRFQQYG